MTGFLRFYAAYGRLVGIAATVAGVATFALMWLVDVNVVARKLFNAPVNGAVEISQIFLVVSVMLGLAYAQATGAHLRVTLLIDHLPLRVREILFTLAMIVGFGVFAVITWSLFNFAMRAFELNEYAWGSGVRLPLFPVKAAACLGALLVTIQFLLDAIRVGIFHQSKLTDGVATEGNPYV